MVMVPPKPPARLDEVARILNLAALMPGRRERPRHGAIFEGPYDVWFDGGACRYHTGLNRFDFADGACAWLSTSLALKGAVTLPSGETVSFMQEPPRTDVCVFCGGILAEGGTFKQTPRGPAHVGCG